MSLPRYVLDLHVVVSAESASCSSIKEKNDKADQSTTTLLELHTALYDDQTGTQKRCLKCDSAIVLLMLVSPCLGDKRTIKRLGECISFTNACPLPSDLLLRLIKPFQYSVPHSRTRAICRGRPPKASHPHPLGCLFDLAKSDPSPLVRACYLH